MGNTPSSQHKANGGVSSSGRPHGHTHSQSHSQSQSQSHSHSQTHGQHSNQQQQQQQQSNAPRPLNASHPAAAQPYSSLESASAQPASQSRPSASDVLRSQTGHSAPPAPHIKPLDSPSQLSQSSTPSNSAMGQSESRPRAPGSAASTPIQTPPTAAKPIEAPSASSSQGRQTQMIPEQDLIFDDDAYLNATSEFSRPPRLPLRIEDQLHTPGSPILSPAELSGPIEPIGTDHHPLISRSSVLSSTTVDEEDVGDDLDTVRGGVLPPVRTVIEWREAGNKVYVTGTFADWDRKYRLLKNGPIKEKDVLSTVINLQPGTYHVKFIVDGDMVLSKHLPQAVDFTNSLVNYIEVIAEDTPATAGLDTLVSDQLQSIPAHSVDVVTPRAEDKQLGDSDVHPPLTIPPTPEIGPTAGPSSVPMEVSTSRIQTGPRKPIVPVQKYTKTIPQFLLDTDADEGTQEYHRTLELSAILPAPPTLPSFLSKSILNMATPMKDDASVLANPNHTVLNHLTTSSIKNRVIATSVTTRYRRKFLTTIMYRPSSLAD